MCVKITEPQILEQFSPALAILLGGWGVIILGSTMHFVVPDGFLCGVFAPKRTFSMYSQVGTPCRARKGLDFVDLDIQWTGLDLRTVGRP